MAEDNFANQEPNIVDDVDIDVLLQRFSDDPIFDFDLDLDFDLLRESWVPGSDPPSNVFQPSGSSSPVPPTSVEAPSMEPSSPDSVSSFVNYIENFLMDDVDWGEGDGGKEVGEDSGVDLFAGALFDGSISSKADVDTPESYDASTKEGHSKEKEVPEVVVVEEDDDFVIKKRRRQMRNRESAMISRERKKLYIKDLEMKNKHLEIEYRRLDYALRCYTAENMALRRSLQFQKNRSCGASVAKQESAVLFMESLLLGSLFWFVSLVCLFLLPSLQSLKILSCSGRDLAMVVARTKSRKSLMLGKDLRLILHKLKRRCRSMKSRMKFFLFPLHAVLA
ncbi:bZIP transcription factor 50 [Dendrobium catenatum]|uniref:BZIP transcription factor 60 n=1 Tax=Dendrobium catenatum TaxID=906689 RepID=A0A2I0VHI6_9ASPA|nr:bZIP transcription factor 50 [Dendrobium catenatum]PKU62870.1 bZIP transcription factor 60 [Dendrobium catenatum]